MTCCSMFRSRLTSLYVSVLLQRTCLVRQLSAGVAVTARPAQIVMRTLQLWDKWSRPYIQRIIQKAKKEHPTVPITVYANGSGGLLERLGSTGADVVGLDWTVDMADARRRLGPDVSVQVCMTVHAP